MFKNPPELIFLLYVFIKDGSDFIYVIIVSNKQ